jgi:peptidoglycan/LPS O-acetylase OafA/YrhL
VYAVLLLGMFAITRDLFTIVCVTTATIILLAGRADKLRVWLHGSVLQFLGKISYSVYLLHLPVVGASFFVLNKLLPRTPVMDLLAGLIVIGVTCAAAQLFWWSVERPSTVLAKRLRKRD